MATHMEIPEKSMLKRDIDNDEDKSMSPIHRKESHGMEYSCFKIIITDMNILKWNVAEFSLEDENKTGYNRKNFLINLSLNYKSINYINGQNPEGFYNSSKILIDHLQAHISPEDLSLLYRTYNKQMEEYWEDSVTLLKNLDKIYNKLQGFYYKIDPKPSCNPNDEEEINEYKQKFTVDKAEILLLSELGERKGLCPFLKIVLKMDPFSIKSIVKSKKMMSCYLELFILFYNPFSNKTEPMLETTPFFLELVKTSEGISYLNFQLNDQIKKKKAGTIKSPMFNLNISEDMLALFFKVKESWSEKLSTPVQYETPNLKASISNFDQTNMKVTPTKDMMLHSHHKKFESRKFSNSYTIKNESGYDLSVRKHERNPKRVTIVKNPNKRIPVDEKKYFIEIKNGDSQEYEIEGDESNFEHNFEKSMKIYMEFKSYSQQMYYIQDVSLNRLRKEQKMWKSHKLTMENFQNKFFMCSVKMKETKTKLNIRSPIIIWNSTNKMVDVRVISEDFDENLVFTIESRKRKAIPIEYAENQSMFSLSFKIGNKFIESEKMFTFWSLKSPQGITGFEAVNLTIILHPVGVGPGCTLDLCTPPFLCTLLPPPKFSTTPLPHHPPPPPPSSSSYHKTFFFKLIFFFFFFFKYYCLRCEILFLLILIMN